MKLFQLPKRSGRPCRGDPVRNRQSTASMNCRLPGEVATGSVALPDSMCSIRANMASVTVLSAFILPPARPACPAALAYVAARMETICMATRSANGPEKVATLAIARSLSLVFDGSVHETA